MAVVDQWWSTKDGEKTKTARYGQGKRWRAMYRGPDGAQRSKSFARKVDADKFLLGVESAKATGSYIAPERAAVTCGELAELWLAGRVDLGASTRSNYRHWLDAVILPRWGSVPLGKIAHADVQAWISGLAGTRAAATVGRYHRILSMILDRAVADERLPRNIAKGVRLPSDETVRERRYLGAAQVEALANACACQRLVLATAHYLPSEQRQQIACLAASLASEQMAEKLTESIPGELVTAKAGEAGQYRLIVLFLAYTGLRWGELAALRVGRLDLARRRARIAESVTPVDGKLHFGTPKGHKGKPAKTRTVPVPAFLVDELAAQVAGKGPDDLVFTSPNGAVLRVANFRARGFDQAAEAIGLPGLHPHELRHTAASLAIASGADVKVVQQMLGHSSAAMTLDQYGHLFADRLDEVADAMGAARAVALGIPDAPPVARMLHGRDAGTPRVAGGKTTGPERRGL